MSKNKFHRAQFQGESSDQPTGKTGKETRSVLVAIVVTAVVVGSSMYIWHIGRMQAMQQTFRAAINQLAEGIEGFPLDELINEEEESNDPENDNEEGEEEEENEEENLNS